MKNIYILLMLFVFLGVPLANSHAQELMLNGDLELWDDSSNPTDWDKAENVSQEDSPVHGGTYSAGHTSLSSSKDLQQVVEGITGGSNYTISYYFLDNDTSAKTRIWSYWLDSGGSTLPDNEAELRPGEYSDNSPDWQHFTVSLTAPVNAAAFRFEVRVYHENNHTGGKVFYDDFSVQLAGVSPEPTNYPTGFAAAASGISIDLSWTDAVGDQLPNAYLVLASDEDNITAPVDGTPVADDTDLSDGSGALNIPFGEEECSFADLEPNTEYFFMIFPYTNGGTAIDFKNDGTAPEASATTEDVSVILSQNFNDGWGNWTRINVSGQQEWEIDDIHGPDGSPCAKASGYDGQPYANEDWLISPAMDLDAYSSEVLVFYNADAYDGPALEALISNDFDGVDPNAATWDPLTFETSSGFFEWVSSGDIDLSGVSGTAVYLGFRFTSTDSESATWELDDILITGGGSTGISEADQLNTVISLYPNPAASKVNIRADSHEQLHVQLFSMTGAAVIDKISFTGEYLIDLGGLGEGIYLLHFTDDAGRSKNKKLIIDR